MTKAFNFTLQKVLDVRTMVEDAKAIELQKAHAETEREERTLAKIKAKKNAIVTGETEPGIEHQPSLHELNNRTAYVEQLTKKIELQGKAVVKSQEEAEIQRLKFVQASKEKMAIEKLKEHHQDAFRKKMNQVQVKLESEVASRITKKRDE